jgi:lipopolysaccharide/colanic/teichoic acid biosynthesis glycosyltransferase
MNKRQLLNNFAWKLRTMPNWKRTLDILLSLPALLLLIPLFFIIGLIIKIVSPGPIFYKQTRVGLEEQLFKMWKFRSMHLNASDRVHKDHFKHLISSNSAMNKLDDINDSRIFSFGNFLRKTGIDELPQIFNVLKGDMSLVGPRPCLPYEAELYLNWQRIRFNAVPGITGLWQINGKNRTTFSQMIQYDIMYMNSISAWKDISIIIKTIPSIIAK